MWQRIIEWFSEITERQRLIKNFNEGAKNAFIEGIYPTLLQAKITTGNSLFRHQFSKFWGGGFRIKALSGTPLKRHEMMEIGNIIIADEKRVRNLISNGWDTLEVTDNNGFNGLQWALKEHANIGKAIPQDNNINSQNK
jgi:hypothetical protein